MGRKISVRKLSEAFPDSDPEFFQRSQRSRADDGTGRIQSFQESGESGEKGGGAGPDRFASSHDCDVIHHNADNHLSGNDPVL